MKKSDIKKTQAEVRKADNLNCIGKARYNFSKSTIKGDNLVEIHKALCCCKVVQNGKNGSPLKRMKIKVSDALTGSIEGRGVMKTSPTAKVSKVEFIKTDDNSRSNWAVILHDLKGKVEGLN